MTRVRARAVHDADVFASLVEPLLAADPVRWTVLAVSVGRARRGGGRSQGVLFFVVEDHESGAVVAAGQHWPPHRIGLHGVASDIGDAAGAAVAGLIHSLGRSPAGVAGRREAAYGFARTWREATGEGARLTRSQRLHALDSLVPPLGVDGAARPAAEADVALVGKWMDAFQAEIGDVTVRGADWAGERLPRVTLWEAGGRPVSLAAHSVPAAGVSRIGPVYTPAESRGHGYGSAVTAAATQAALADGASGVCLYTDLANPVSNAIYARLGYIPVGDEVELTFGAAPG